MTTYINGIKAGKKDIARLEKDSKAGRVKVTAKTTKGGNIAYKVEELGC